jgi:serine/threonine protein kinase
MSSSDQPEKVALIFEECIDIADPMVRAAYLDDACGGCPSLRNEVETLLRAHDRSGGFLLGGTTPKISELKEKIGLEADDLQPGGCVGPYRLVGLIGEGSTSTVFLAEQEEPVRRWVALKIVKPGMDTKNVLLRFGLERQALALMDHPGIAKLLDAGATTGGRPYFVMELVTGLGITSYCDQNKLSIPERLHLFKEICNAVLHAHQRGIIHRDIKPDNILVSRPGGRVTLKVIDFGIAKVLHSWGLENATRSGMAPFMGTPAYMSPEQVQMTSPDLDTRTDIYSLGALLYELLAGHPPFDARFLMEVGIEEMIRIIRTRDPLTPSDRYAELPDIEQLEIAKARNTTPTELKRILKGDLDWISLKALEKSRDKRYQTTAGLKEDINRYFENLPVKAASSSNKYRMAKLLKRHRKSVVAAGSVGVVLVLSAIIMSFMAVRANYAAAQARILESEAIEAERKSHEAMVSMHVSSGMAAVDDRYYDKAILWFANAARFAGAEDYQAEVNSRRAISWLNKTPLPLGAFKLTSSFKVLEFSSDSRYLVAVSIDGKWQLWNAWTRQVVPWKTSIKGVKTAAWSMDGKCLALGSNDGEISVIKVDGGSLLASFKLAHSPEAIAFSPDGTRLLASNDQLNILDIASARPADNVPVIQANFTGLAFSGSTGAILGTTNDDHAGILKLDSNNRIKRENPINFPHQQVIRTEGCSSKSNYQEDFLANPRLSMPVMDGSGDRLITRTGSYHVTLWDTRSGNPIEKIDGVCCSCRFVTNKQMDLLACGIQGGKVGIWDIRTAKSRQLLPSKGSCVLDIAFGMNGNRVFTGEANGMARLWDVDTGREIQPPIHHNVEVDMVAVAGNGRMLATGQSDGLVRIWSVSESRQDDHEDYTNDLPAVARMDKTGRNFVFTREPNWKENREYCFKTVSIFSTVTKQNAIAPMHFNSCVETVEFSPHSQLIAVGIASSLEGESARVEILDLAEKAGTGRKYEMPSSPASIAWHPLDGKLSVLCKGGELLIITPGIDMPLQLLEPSESPRSHLNLKTSFTADGRILVVMGPDGKIQVRNSINGKLMYQPIESEPSGFWSFSLSEDSLYMATSTTDGDVAIWDLVTGFQVGKTLHHPRWVYQSSFSPDSNSLITASRDGMVRLWNWRDAKLISSPMHHPREVYYAMFTPDSKWILTACRDGNVRVWEPFSAQILSPPFKAGNQAFNIELTKDGHSAVVGSLSKDISLFSLNILYEDIRYDAEELCLLGEVLSGCSINKGSIRELPSEDWLQRFQKLRALHPELLDDGTVLGIQKFLLSDRSAHMTIHQTLSGSDTAKEQQFCPKDISLPDTDKGVEIAESIAAINCGSFGECDTCPAGYQN